MDLLVGQENGHIYLPHFHGLAPDVLYTPRLFLSNNVTLSYRLVVIAVSVLYDWSGNGALDLVVEDVGGDISLFENISTPSQPRFSLPVKLSVGSNPIRIQAGATGSIQVPAEATCGYHLPNGC